MAVIIINNLEYAINDGSKIQDICQKAGVIFNCNAGVCGSCLIKIIDGAKNLSPLTDEERDLGLDEQNRLACQCTILSGTVKATF